MHLSVTQWLLVGGTIALQIMILFVMIRRRFRAAFPFFFNFIIYSLLTLLFQLAIVSHISESTYFYLFWTLAGISTLFCFAITYEVFVHILKPYSALVDLGKLLFRWAIVFLALASLLTVMATNGSEGHKICAAIQLLERSSQMMLCGLLLLMILVKSRLGLSWHSPAICVMVGFGSNAALALGRSLVEAYFPNSAYLVDLAGAVSCVAVYGLWFASFALPQPVLKTAQDSPSRLIFQRWNEALLATPLVTRKSQVAFAPVESFLPGVEQTVERVMARKMMH